MNTPGTDTLLELIGVLTALTAFLAFYEERLWSNRLRDDLELIQTGDPHGLEALLVDITENREMHGATPLLAPENGHNLRWDEVEGVNKRLENLWAEVERRAVALKRLYEA